MSLIWQAKTLSLLSLPVGRSAETEKFEQIREEAVNAGLITNEEIDQALALLDNPNFAISAHMMFTAWGRRPY